MNNLAINYTDYQDEQRCSDFGVLTSQKTGYEEVPHNTVTADLVELNSTVLTIDERCEKKSTEALLSIKSNVVESLEHEFFCIIDSVDNENQLVDVSVYDIKERIQVLEISSSFSEFLLSERNKIRPNASFYWRVGSRTVTHVRKDKEFNQTSSFSEFRMRLKYVSPRALKGRLESRVSKYANFYS